MKQEIVCIKLSNPKSVDTLKVKRQVFNLIASGVKSKDIGWEIDGGVNKAVMQWVSERFQLVKNSVDFELEKRSVDFPEVRLKKDTCVIRNEMFSWVLYVDGESIGFAGGLAADYFEKHYKSLGYEVTVDRDYYKRNEE